MGLGATGEAKAPLVPGLEPPVAVEVSSKAKIRRQLVAVKVDATCRHDALAEPGGSQNARGRQPFQGGGHDA